MLSESAPRQLGGRVRGMKVAFALALFALLAIASYWTTWASVRGLPSVRPQSVSPSVSLLCSLSLHSTSLTSLCSNPISGKSRKLALMNRSSSSASVRPSVLRFAVTDESRTDGRRDGFSLVSSDRSSLHRGKERERKGREGREGVKLEFLCTARASLVVLPSVVVGAASEREGK